MLKDKVCMVTGAASGIGLGIAKKFAQERAALVMCDVNAQRLEEEAAAIGGDPYPADLSTREGCRGFADYALKKYGRIDVLVNVAGIQTVSPIEDFPEDKWDFMIALMLTAPFLLTKYVFPSMKEQGWGRIIHINSIHGLVASKYKAAYVSAKHGLAGLTKVTALEGGEFGITANSICPSYVRTPLVDNQIDAQAKTHGISREAVIENVMLANASVKKLLEPQNIAEIAYFLCTEAAGSITGSMLTVDGGWTAV